MQPLGDEARISLIDSVYRKSITIEINNKPTLAMSVENDTGYISLNR